MFGEFVSNLPAQVAELKALGLKGDVGQLSYLAHDLKGSSGNFSANSLRALAFELEQASKENQLDEAQILIAQIEEQVTLLRDYLTKIRG